jgi:methyl-accepting chemotaxis protein
LEQVNTAVANMDQVTQKNAAMVEETSAAAHALAAEAELLAKLMTHFQTSPSMDDPLRRELMNAAPHAFREPRPSSAGEEDLSRRSTRQATRLPAAKARAGGGRVIARAGSEEDDWREF